MSSDPTRESDLTEMQSQPTRRYNRPTLVRLKPIVVGDRPDQRPTIEVPRPVPATVAPARAPRQKKKNASSATTFARVFSLFFAALAIVILASSLVVYGVYASGDRIVPGVRVNGQLVGNLPYAQALAVITQGWDASRTVRLSDGSRTYEVPLSDLGVTFDGEATAESALAIGRSGPIWQSFGGMMGAMIGGREIGPVLVINRDQLAIALAGMSEALSIPAKNASLRIDGTEITIIEAEPGRALAIEDTIALITEDPGKLVDGGSISLAFDTVAPSLMAADIEPVIDEAKAILAQPVSVTAYEPVTGEYISYSASPDQIASWLTVEESETGPVIGVSDEASNEVLRAFSDSLTHPAYIDVTKYSGWFARALREGGAPTLVINHHPTTYTVQGSESLLWVGWKHGIPYYHFYDANPGKSLEVLYPGEQLVVPSIDVMFPVEVVPDKRIVISISEQHMWLYENGVVVNDFIISTGIADSPTMPGVFQVFMRDPWAYGSAWDLWMPHFLGIYESVPGFTNGIHGLPTLSSGGILWANVLGQPASYGCIILNLGPDELVYNWAPDGTIVEIQR